MRPHFKRFFRSMAQKDLLLSDACLPFCGHSLLFFCRRFLFQIKRKCRNAGSVKSLIIVGREGRYKILRIHIVSIKLYRFRGRMISAPTAYISFIALSEAKQTPQSWLRQSSSPAGEPKNRRVMFATIVGKINIYEDFVPLSRHRCVEVADPYKPH